MTTDAAWSEDDTGGNDDVIKLEELSNGLLRLRGGSSDLTPAEALKLGLLLLEAASTVDPKLLAAKEEAAAKVIPPGGRRNAAEPGEFEPCPVCSSPMDAHQADLFRESLYIDKASDLAKFLEATGKTAGLAVRFPTFTTGPNAAEAREQGERLEAGLDVRCSRCGELGHVRSPPGRPAGENCRAALGDRDGRSSDAYLPKSTELFPFLKRELVLPPVSKIRIGTVEQLEDGTAVEYEPPESGKRPLELPPAEPESHGKRRGR